MDSRGETGSFQDRPSIILIAGFGDSAEMFERLMETSLAAVFRLVPIQRGFNPAGVPFWGENDGIEIALNSLIASIGGMRLGAYRSR